MHFFVCISEHDLQSHKLLDTRHFSLSKSKTNFRQRIYHYCESIGSTVVAINSEILFLIAVKPATLKVSCDSFSNQPC